jgi:hypothetical protein
MDMLELMVKKGHRVSQVFNTLCSSESLKTCETL